MSVAACGSGIGVPVLGLVPRTCTHRARAMLRVWPGWMQPSAGLFKPHGGRGCLGPALPWFQHCPCLGPQDEGLVWGACPWLSLGPCLSLTNSTVRSPYTPAVHPGQETHHGSPKGILVIFDLFGLSIAMSRHLAWSGALPGRFLMRGGLHSPA